MSPFNTFLFLVFVLPVVILKEGWRLLTGKMPKEERSKLLWRIPYVLIVLIIILMIVLFAKGYR